MTIIQFMRVAFFRPMPKLNIWKTIYLNYKLLPIKQAVHFPIHLYGKWNFRMMNGTILIPTNQVKCGAYKFGFDTAGYFTSLINTLSLHTDSTIELGEEVRIGQGVQICLYPKAVLKMGSFSSLGDNVKIVDYQSIIIGKRTAITWDCQISDFNSHFILDSATNKIFTICKPVQIGDYCWVCNKTVVMPGTKLPNRIIVASGSLLNRDYVKLELPERSLIGGAPAKLIKSGLYRIYNRETENYLKDYFLTHPEETVYVVTDQKSFAE